MAIKTSRTIVVLWLLALALVLSVVAVAIIFQAHRAEQTAKYWVDHTNEVIQNTNNILVYFKEAEANQRGYLLTKDTAYLMPYRNAEQQLRHRAENITRLIQDNPDQAQLFLSEVMPFIRIRLDTMDHTVRYFSEHQTADVHSYFQSRDFIKVQDGKIWTSLHSLIINEEKLLEVRNAHLIKVSDRQNLTMYISLSLIGIASVLAFFTIIKARRLNGQLFESLKESNSMLELRVLQQTGTILDANAVLQKQNEDLAAINEELTASQEELSASVEYISALKADVEKSEKLYRMLTEHSLDIIAVFTIDNKFEYVSPSVRSVLGYEPAELIGVTGSDLIHPDDLSAAVDPTIIAREGKEIESPHFRFRRKDGTYVWIEAYSNPIFNDSGEVIKVHTLSRDISERKATEFLFRTAREKAEEATKAKSQFLSSMSHEIRTPMNAVIGLTNILLDNAPREDQAEKLQLLKFSGENLLTIINDVLDFSKIEAGKLTIEYVAFDLHELLDNIHKLNGKKADDKGIAFKLAIERGVPGHVTGDPVRINQVITNIVSNAIKFTENGSVEIRVGSESSSSSASKVWFTITDTGIGIEQEKIDMIFESFSQANADTTRKYGGTGLGLSITKELVKLMDGELIVTSEPGTGSVFAFYLVLAHSDARPEEDMITTYKGDVLPIKAKVLLVEDNQVNQYVAKNYLDRWGLAVDFASDGLKAVEMIKDKSYHIVLMDLQMPKMDGYTAAKTIRSMADSYFKEIPIIALTAEAMVEIKQKAFDHGMNGYVTKPFNAEELHNVVFKFIREFIKGEVQQPEWSKNFDLFTNGDENFKKGLSKLFLVNIEELSGIVSGLKVPGQLPLFSDAVHKAKTTLTVLNDKTLNDVTEQIRIALKNDDTVSLSGLIGRFTSASERLANGLNNL
ncbi:MAG: ATP-binding protein [Chryseolinea sp.]